MENYYYNDEGVYTGRAPAQSGTVSPDNALRIPPPEREGFRPVVNAARDGWDLVEDHVGRKGWINGLPAVIERLGPFPKGWSDSPSPAADPEARTRLYLTNAGTYHRPECRCTGFAGQWLSLAEITARRPTARPCGRCRPLASEGAAQ